MFSANENLMLREYKKRVVQYIESTIPEEALDMGTMVMVMQTACRTPGCVPLETSIAICFPRAVPPPPKTRASTTTDTTTDTTTTDTTTTDTTTTKERKDDNDQESKEWIKGVKESSGGGTYKTRILLPLSEVTKDDVLDALPPGFEGGRKTWEHTCMALRDLVIGRIGGMVGSTDVPVEVEERRILAEYLQSSLDDYLQRNCVAPGLGLPFDNINEGDDINKDDDKKGEGDSPSPDIDHSSNVKDGSSTSDTTDTNVNASTNVIKGTMQGNGNFIIRRRNEDDDDNDNDNGNDIKDKK